VSIDAAEVASVCDIQHDLPRHIVGVPIVIRVIIQFAGNNCRSGVTDKATGITLYKTTPASTGRSTLTANAFGDSSEVSGVVRHGLTVARRSPCVKGAVSDHCDPDHWENFFSPCKIYARAPAGTLFAKVPFVTM